jgi:hypothetical protein
MKRKRLERKIKYAFCKNQKIDVLFISHFHDDHINGIKYLKNYCRIQRVVMPYIDDEAKVLLKIFNRLNGGTSILPLIDNPQKFFGGIPITTIKYFLPDAPATDNPPKKFSTIRGSQEDESDTSFILDTEIEDWYYIPYNFDDKNQRNKFWEKLGMSWKDIDTPDKMKKHWKKIKATYKELFKTDEQLHENSMVLFSGRNGKDKDTITCSGNGHCPTEEIPCGCLYTGDVDLNKTVYGIKAKLKIFYDNIGTLQVPHHGSNHNFNSVILDDSNIKCAVASYGILNSYGHPSSKVIGDIQSKGVCVHCVTEDPVSEVKQTKK